MVHIYYKLLPSKIHGIGCFADQDIPKDFCVVEASPMLDINLTEEQYGTLSMSEQDQIRHHGHFDKITQKWHVDFDMTRFANHSENPNLIQLYNEKGYYILSLREISLGEELTINYSDFEYTDDTRGKNIFPFNMPLHSLISSLQSHTEHFPDDRIACERTISWIREHGEFAFVKEGLGGHITGSLLITNPEKTKVLLMFHKKYKEWVQFGGHCDGETDVKNVAIREFHEESGIQVEPIILDDIFSVIVWDVVERTSSTGMYQPAHQHYDIIYLGVIPEDTLFSRQESEVDDIQWFDIDGIEDHVDDDMAWRIQRIQSLGK